MSEIIKCKRIIFRAADHVETRGWGHASMNQTGLDNKLCQIEIHLGLRIFRVVPNNPNAEPFEGPLEIVQQWFRLTDNTDQPRRKARTASAPEA